MASHDVRPFDQLVERAMSIAPIRGFRSALEAVAAEGDIAVISEIKRKSPSKGELVSGLDPATLARQYELGGAACMSVLTDTDFFGGSIEDLVAARGACSIPVLRKDFTVSARDVCDARIMGADCVLLIAAALDQLELESFLKLAQAIGIDALVEIHDERELDRAVLAGADLIGVNQRDLVTFAVDTERAQRMAPQMPAGVVRVAESGITGPADAGVLAEAGYHAVLVGEHLVTSGDPAGGVAALRNARQR